MGKTEANKFVESCKGTSCQLIKTSSIYKCTVVECSLSKCSRKQELDYWINYIPKDTVRESIITVNDLAGYRNKIPVKSITNPTVNKNDSIADQILKDIRHKLIKLDALTISDVDE